MFSTEERDNMRDRVLQMVRADPRVTAGALTGSRAVGAEDEWSDIDLAFGIAEGISIEAVLADWTEVFGHEFGALHHWDLRSGSSIYRVFLLPSGLEVDVAVTPQNEFGARGPRFHSLFGNALQLAPAPQTDARYLIGLCWHHVLHARSSIERGKPWRAEYWISALRDHTLELSCMRLGEDTAHARGTDSLPAAVTGPLAGALVCSLDEVELRRALAVATACFLVELEASDSALCARLKSLVQEFGAPKQVSGER